MISPDNRPYSQTEQAPNIDLLQERATKALANMATQQVVYEKSAAELIGALKSSPRESVLVITVGDTVEDVDSDGVIKGFERLWPYLGTDFETEEIDATNKIIQTRIGLANFSNLALGGEPYNRHVGLKIKGFGWSSHMDSVVNPDIKIPIGDPNITISIKDPSEIRGNSSTTLF